MTITKILTTLLFMLAGLSALFTLAPTADAYPGSGSGAASTTADAQYIAFLASEGITFTDGGATAISLGHTIGDTLTASPTVSTLETIAIDGVKAGVSPHDVAYITVAAVRFYAPPYMTPVLSRLIDELPGNSGATTGRTI